MPMYPEMINPTVGGWIRLDIKRGAVDEKTKDGRPSQVLRLVGIRKG